ncbi:hypothetical protein JHL18_20845 [Clostridium sp. YIM B02505]|uniref:Uncharacterized protein n=1 Tax=Clostridium yunnanense TaxID=2800325 RepID=A0ABS1EUS4_9CLOT|nr:hypothetical protein [Clostridium yunnanense]MBK1813073.1 hypothetical protein [Clostridium yunnanense]
MSQDDKKPAIKKNLDAVPKNPSKLRDARFNNKSISKEKEKMYNPSLIKTKKKEKNPSMNKKYNYITDDDKKAYTLARVLLGIFSGAVIIGIFVIFIVSSNSSDKDMYKGKAYFEYLGISGASAYNEKLDNKYDLVKSDNYYAGTFSSDGENYYRFEVEKQGEKSYDMEISSLQCSVSEEDNLDKGYVEIFKRTYKSTSGKFSGKDVNAFYYKLHVPKGTLKTFE